MPGGLAHEPWKLSAAQRLQYAPAPREIVAVASSSADEVVGMSGSQEMGGYPLKPIARPGQSWGTREQSGGGGKGGGGKGGGGGGGYNGNRKRGGPGGNNQKFNSRAARDKQAEQQQGKQQRRRAARVQHGYMMDE